MILEGPRAQGPSASNGSISLAGQPPPSPPPPPPYPGSNWRALWCVIFYGSSLPEAHGDGDGDGDGGGGDGDSMEYIEPKPTP